MNTQNTIENITTGESWACKFRVQTFIDKNGKPFDTRNLGIGEKITEAEPGFYTGTAVIQTRDTVNRLVELWDIEQSRLWIVNWNDCWDIDRVDWIEKEKSS